MTTPAPQDENPTAPASEQVHDDTDTSPHPSTADVRVVVNHRLANYLRARHQRFIIIDLAECNSCGGDIIEPFARLAKESEAARLIAASAAPDARLAVNQYSTKANRARIRTFTCVDEEGNALIIEDRPVQVLVLHRLVRLNPEVHLGLRRYFGIADITTRGVTF